MAAKPRFAFTDVAFSKNMPLDELQYRHGQGWCVFSGAPRGPSDSLGSSGAGRGEGIRRRPMRSARHTKSRKGFEPRQKRGQCASPICGNDGKSSTRAQKLLAMKRLQKAETGITLVEVLVVVAIVGILAAIIFPALSA